MGSHSLTHSHVPLISHISVIELEIPHWLASSNVSWIVKSWEKFKFFVLRFFSVQILIVSDVTEAHLMFYLTRSFMFNFLFASPVIFSASNEKKVKRAHFNWHAINFSWVSGGMEMTAENKIYWHFQWAMAWRLRLIALSQPQQLTTNTTSTTTSS